MTINRIFENLVLSEKVFRSLILTSNYKKIGNNSISWDNYTPGIFKNLYAKEYEFVVRNRQYSFLLSKDKGCVQFFYSFDGDSLTKAKLAYYPYPIKLKNLDDLEHSMYDAEDVFLGEYYYDVWNILNHEFQLGIADENLKELVEEAKKRGNSETAENIVLGKFESKYEFTNSSHIRIDFDPDVEVHNKCEIQVGAINNLRLPMKKLIMPFTFLDFIIKNVFQEEYLELKGKQDYKTNFSVSKGFSLSVNPFSEENLKIDHD